MTAAKKAAWAERRMRLRKRIVRITDTLRNEGEIEELDLDRLHNFCMVMLMLLAKVEPNTLRAAVKEAEIAAWLKGDIYDVVMDSEIVK